MNTKPQVLVVEDDLAIAKLFSDLLPAHGIEVTIASRGEEALERFRNGNFDLVVADKNLPGFNGIDLVAQLKPLDPDIDIIIMTAHADMKSVLRALKEGVYDYLIKPFPSIHDVLQKVQRGLEKRRMRKENLELIKNLRDANDRIAEMNRSLEAQVRDRTLQLELANQRLEGLSLSDDVTDLYNQRFLYQRLEEEFRRARRYLTPLSVIMLDIDNFKGVNDNHDHLFGSRALRRTGEVLLRCVRNVDMCVRYGGDEFVVVLPHTCMQEAIRVAERIRTSVAETNVGDADDPYTITVSVGVAALNECQADSPKSLLRAADRALMAAKRAGRNRVLKTVQQSVVAAVV